MLEPTVGGKRQVDMVMAWSVDRLGRGLQDLVGFLSELHASDCLPIDSLAQAPGASLGARPAKRTVTKKRAPCI